MQSPLRKLKDIVKQLRAPGGCPWDNKQTPQSITPHIIEEAYELVDAIQSNDLDKIKDELSDVLLHVVMLTEMIQEKNGFSFDDVADHCSEKMIRRHPHVFGNKHAKNETEVWDHWESIKSKETKGESILNSIPDGLPALLKAHKIQKKVARIGFDWPDKNGPIEKLFEECKELANAIKSNIDSDIDDEIGDILFAIVNILRKNNKSSEELLQLSNKKFTKRFKTLEQLLKHHKKDLSKCNLDELNTFWDQAKKLNKK